MLLLIEKKTPKISQIKSYGCQFVHNGGGLFHQIKRVVFVWLAKIWYHCQPHACKHIICLQALPSLSICLQIYHSLQTTCLQTYHMFASQLAWHLCKSAAWKASNSQFPLQACWHIGIMECHLCVTQMLARVGRCISVLPLLFLGVWFGNFLW